jgi:hypothetical protein
MDEKKTLEILLKFGLDATKAKQAVKELDNVKKSAEQTRKELNEMRESSEKMAQVGSRIAMAGAAITAPFLLAANKYVQTSGVLESTSARWISSMKRIEQAQMRVGRVAADAINPALEKAADLADRLATTFEKNPGALQGILGAGAGLATAGGVVTGGAQIAGALASLKNLQAGGGAAGAVAGGAMKLGQVTLLATSVVIGAQVGSLLGNAIGRWLKGDQWKEQNLGDAAITATKYATLGPQAVALGLKNLGWISDDTAARVGKWANSVVGAVDDVVDTADELEKKAKEVKEAAVSMEDLKAFSSLNEAISARKEYEQKAEEERTRIVEQQGKQRAELESRYEKQRSDFVADYAKQERDSEADYYQQRSQTAQNYNVEVQRAEEDHQREMRRMQQEHNTRVTDLVDQRDALGLLRENQSYEKERRSAEDDYQLQARRRSEDFARQISEVENNFASQRARRERDFQERVAQMAAQHAEEMTQFDAQNKERLNELDDQAEKELAQLRKNENDRLTLYNMVHVQHMTLAEAELKVFQDRTLSAYNNWLQQIGNSGQAYSQYQQGEHQSYASGGYVESNRVIRAGDRGYEFIMSHNTTRAAERVMRGRLTQQSALRALAEGGGRTVNLTIQSGNATLSQVQRMVDDSAASMLRGLTAAMGA